MSICYLSVHFPACFFLVNPSNEFTAKIDAPISNQSDVDYVSKGATEEQIETKQSVG